MKLYNSPYSDGLHEAVIDLMKSFPQIKQHILKLESARSLFEAYYQVLVGKKEIIPIENNPVEYKQKFWNATKELTDKGQRIKAARALYLIAKINLE